MNTQRIGILALALTAIASVLPAQQGTGAAPRRTPPAGAPTQPAPGGQRGPGGRGGMGGDMRGGSAAMILGRGAQLNLTDDQVKKLQAMQNAQKDAEPSQTAMMRMQADLMDANKGEGNIEAARAALDKMSRARNDAIIARMKSRKDAREVLTAAQRGQLDQMGARLRQGAAMRMRGAPRMRMQRGMQRGRTRGMQRGGMGRGMRDGNRGGMMPRNRPGMQGGPRFNRMGSGDGMRGPGMGPMRMRQDGGPGINQSQMDRGGPPPMRGNRMRRGDGPEIEQDMYAPMRDQMGAPRNDAPPPPRPVRRPPGDSIKPDSL